MTAEITFCDACDASIPASDLERGVAGHSDGRLLCTLCYRGLRRRRIAFFAVAPLALLAAAALGAATSVLLLGGEIGGLRDRVGELEGRLARAEAPDEGLVRELEGLASVDREQTLAIERIGGEAARQIGALAGAVEEVSGQTAVLSVELRVVKERLAEAATSPVLAEPAPEVDLERLLELTGSNDWGARLSGVVGIAEAEDPRVDEALLHALADASSHVRGEAATVLGSRGDRRAIAPLVELLLDENRVVRRNAQKALEKILDETIPYDALAVKAERERVVALLRARFAKD